MTWKNNEQLPVLTDCRRKKMAKVVWAVSELGEGVSQEKVRQHLGLSDGAGSVWVRQALGYGFIEDGGREGGGYSLKITELGRDLMGDHKPVPTSPRETTSQETASVEEIILRLSRTVERLLEENERLKPENEKLAREEQRLTADSEELLKDNLRLEGEVRNLKEKIESYKEEIGQLRQLRSSSKIDLLPRVSHAMAVFGD